MSAVALSPAEQVRQWQDNYRRLTLSPARSAVVPMERVRPTPPPPPPPKPVPVYKGPRDILDLAAPPPIRIHRDPAVTLDSVARHYGFTADDIRGPRRFASLVKARHAAYAALAEARPDWSLLRVARYCNRDHTTVLHALRKMGVRP